MGMVQLVRKSNSLLIVLLIYLQVFTSPFHKYYQSCTQCQAIHGNERRQGHQSRHENNAKMVETIIVSDEDSHHQNKDDATYCDKISKSSYNNRSLYCIDHDQCPKMLATSNEQVRSLTCGLRYDGAIKVCCPEMARSIDSDTTSTNNGTSDTQIISDDTLVIEVSNHKNNSSHHNLPLTNSTETLIVVDGDSSLNKPGSNKEHQRKQYTNAEEAKQRLISSKILAKFPRECGISGGWKDMDETRIIGGEAAIKNAWPWFAILLVQRQTTGQRSPECGATLISSKFVLTAAHCILEMGKKPMKRERITIRLGEFDLTKHHDGEVDFAVERIIPHPYFQPKTFKNDIALLELDRKVNYPCNTTQVLSNIVEYTLR